MVYQKISLYLHRQLKTLKNNNMKDFEIYVDGLGFADTFIVKAKNLSSAKKKAKAKAISEFSKTLKAYNVTD